MVERENVAADAPGSGHVTLIGAGPGAPDLITVRGLRALQSAEVVLYDALIDERILEGLTAELVYVGKRNGHHSVPQEDINALLLKYARSGKRVARLKGGDSMVLGRGGEEILFLAKHNIPCDVVPGVTSSVAGPELAGIPITHRGLADSFVVLTAHRRCGDEGAFSIPQFHASTTVVVMMGVSTVEHWQQEMLTLGYPGDLPVAFVTEASTPHQEVHRCTLASAPRAVADQGIRSPSVAVVGRVAGLSLALSPAPALPVHAGHP